MTPLNTAGEYTCMSANVYTCVCACTAQNLEKTETEMLFFRYCFYELTQGERFET